MHDGDGSQRVMLLSGEAGIGKSRLVREAKAIAVELGFDVLQGNCYEQDHGLPFASFVDLLRKNLTGLRDLSGLPQLLKLAPDLAPQFPDVQLASVAEPEQEKRTLLRAWMSSLVETRHSASLLVIEDLHWCDDLSLELLLQLARAVLAQPILLLLTYRSDQTTPSLNQLLAQLDRERSAHEISLKPLAVDSVELMMRAIFKQAQPISIEFVNAINRLAEGSPFFVEEILKTLVESGDIFFASGRWDRKTLSELRVPRTVQVAVAQRTERQSDAAKRVLAVAAVIGQRFDVGLLQTLTAISELQLLATLRELMSAQLIVEGTADEFAFRHALTREAVYAALLKRERRALHLAVGEALETQRTGTPSERDAILAHHFYLGEAWEKALIYAQQAGERAQALFAPHEAIVQFTQAIEAVKALFRQTGEVGALHRARGKAYEQVGEFDNALADFEAALVAARTNDNQQVIWQTQLDLGFLWASRDYLKAGALFQRALEIVPQLDDPRSAASTLNRMGNWHMNAERPFEAIRYHDEALRLFESLGDKHGIASTLDLLGISHYAAGEYHRSIEFYSRAVLLFREVNDKGGLLTALAIGSSRGIAFLGRTVLPTQSLLRERVQDCSEVLRMALDMGARPIETLAHTWLGLNHAMSGDYAPALDHARRGLAVAEDIQHPHFICTAHMVLGVLHWDVAAWDVARAHLQMALGLAHETNSIVWKHFSLAFLVSALIQLNDLADAEKVLGSEWNHDTPMNGAGFRQMWAARAELWLAQGEPKRALELIERLIGSAPNFGMYRSDKIPAVVLLHGEALLEMGRSRDAAKILEAGLAGARECDLPALEWRLGVALGKALLADGKRDDAAQAFASARGLAESLASKLTDDTLRTGLITAATVSMSRVLLDSPRRKAKAQSAGLTAREREVAAQIAQGKSNRAIAEAMVLSERTIESHVANILGKLGFESRAQIAVWATENKLR